uniref:FLYWCH-type domain-containing protein n=1 Tax=Acrobeloides nanus TaxID=290746 RepID=A0A914D5V1_9BILA
MIRKLKTSKKEDFLAYEGYFYYRNRPDSVDPAYWRYKFYKRKPNPCLGKVHEFLNGNIVVICEHNHPKDNTATEAIRIKNVLKENSTIVYRFLHELLKEQELTEKIIADLDAGEKRYETPITILRKRQLKNMVSEYEQYGSIEYLAAISANFRF